MTREVDATVTKEQIDELTEKAVNSPRVQMLIERFRHERDEYFLAMRVAFGQSGGAIPDVDKVRDEYHSKLVGLHEAIVSTAMDEAREKLEAIASE